MNQDFEVMYHYYKHLINDPKVIKDKIIIMVKKKDVDKLGNLNSAVNKFYQFMVDYYNYNKFPKIVSDEKYNQIPIKETYHGFTSLSHPATLLTHWNYHYGQGIIPGFYSTDVFEHAKRYTVKDEYWGFTRNERVMKMKYLAQKSISLQEIEIMASYLFHPEMINLKKHPEEKKKIDELRSFAVKKDPVNAHDFLTLFLSDAILAIYLGYDSIICDKSMKNVEYLISLDRAKIVLSLSEAKRFMKHGKSFKNGLLNIVPDSEIDELLKNDNQEILK